MAAERVSMRQIREVLRLRFASELPQRAISKSLGLSQGAVSGYLSPARAAGVSWPLPAELDDVQLEALLFPPLPAIAADQRPLPDWAWVHRELRRPNVTLALLWEEYRAGAPDGFGYSWFCDLYRGWAGRLKPTMRQTHIAGEKLFVDFAGRAGEVVDGLTGEIISVQIFVAVLGASNFTYSEAVWSQKPLTARELEEESPVEAAVGAEVDVLDDGRLAWSGLAQAAGEPLVLAAGRFAVDEQPEPIANPRG
jgi:hypothetical protein